MTNAPSPAHIMSTGLAAPSDVENKQSAHIMSTGLAAPSDVEKTRD